MKTKCDKGLLIMILPVLFAGLILTGEIMCIVKACRCNWEPIGKAEVIYTAAALTGVGAVVGWINIEDK